MGGIPGKSKGCNLCRKRKIACDQVRPECGQCLKYERPCPGYNRERKFLNQYGDNQDAKAIPTTATAEPGKASKVSDRKFENISWRNENLSLSRRYGKVPEPESSLYEISARYTFRNQFIGKFIDVYLPNSEKAVITSRSPLSWLQLCWSLSDPGEALQCAMTAVSVAKAGRIHRDPRLVLEAHALYGTALLELRKALWDKSMMHRDETLAAATTLSIYEIHECGSESLGGWFSHGDGTARMIQLRGSSCYTSPLGHQLFEEFRYRAMIQSIQRRRSSFIQQPDWLNDPWEIQRKPALQLLIDLGLEISRILEQGEFISKTQTSAQALKERLDLLGSCRALDQRFKTWYDLMLRETPGPHYRSQFSTMGSPIDDSEHGKVFPVAFQYPNLRVAGTLMVYWALSLLLHGTVLLNLRSIRDAENLQAPVSAPGSICTHYSDMRRLACCICGTSDPIIERVVPHLDFSAQAVESRQLCATAAQNICQSIEYCIDEEMGLLGPMCSVFPLRTAMQCYINTDSRKLRWCQAVFQTLLNDKGLRFTEYIVNAEWETE